MTTAAYTATYPQYVHVHNDVEKGDAFGVHAEPAFEMQASLRAGFVR